jgi:hypothetical protein
LPPAVTGFAEISAGALNIKNATVWRYVASYASPSHENGARQQGPQHGDERNNREAERNFATAVNEEAPARGLRYVRSRNPRREHKAVHCRECQHQCEKRDLHEEQQAVMAGEQRRLEKERAAITAAAIVDERVYATAARRSLYQRCLIK